MYVRRHHSQSEFSLYICTSNPVSPQLSSTHVSTFPIHMDLYVCKRTVVLFALRMCSPSRACVCVCGSVRVDMNVLRSEEEAKQSQRQFPQIEKFVTNNNNKN